MLSTSSTSSEGSYARAQGKRSAGLLGLLSAAGSGADGGGVG